MSFLSFYSFFSDVSKRELGALQSIYEIQTLYPMLRKMVEKHLPSDAIRDKKILLKPNLVKQNLISSDEYCLRTNDSLILAFTQVILEYQPKEIVIGDAPIQGCDWNEMSAMLQSGIETLGKDSGIPITLVDFRRVAFDPVTNSLTKERRPWERYVLFDLGARSFLEPLCDDKRKPFRILQYNRDRLAQSHHAGHHCYCIAKEFFECDTVIVMPKIKTHEKVCFTNALKIIVGINGDKDFLPHHRIGGTKMGGDCYKGGNLLRRFSEWMFDMANYQIGHWLYRPLYIAGRLLWKLSLPGPEHPFTAGWYGNDTTWRMVMDLNMIARYGAIDGKIYSTPQRKYYALCDGIIAGEGNGPLRPEPFPLGLLAFSDDPFLADAVIGQLLGLDPQFVPTIQQAIKQTGSLAEQYYLLNGEEVSLEQILALTLPVKRPIGWKRYDQIH